MKKITVLLILTALIGFNNRLNAQSKMMESVVAQINSSLQLAANDINFQSNPLKLKSATITLKTSSSKEAEGGFDIVVVKADGSIEKKATSSIEYSFVPRNDKGLDMIQKANESDPNFEHRLTELIKEAATTINALQESEVGELIPGNVKLSISFEVAKTVSAGGGFNLGIVEIGGEAAGSKANAHAVVLTFS